MLPTYLAEMQRKLNVKPKKKLARKIIEEYIQYYQLQGIREMLYSWRNDALQALENKDRSELAIPRENIHFDADFLELYFEAAHYLHLIKRVKKPCPGGNAAV